MKRFFILLSFLYCAVAGASPVQDSYSFFFETVKLNDLARVVFSDVLDKSFVFDSAFLVDSQSVGFVLKNAKKSEVKTLLFSLLDRHGYVIRDGKYFVVLKKEPEEKLADEMIAFYYKPKFRSVSYISDLVASLFEKGKFSTNRQIRQMETLVNPTVSTVRPGQVAQNQAPGVKPPVADTGTSAYSLQDKEKDAFIFHGTIKEIEKLKALLPQVDVASGQVLVRAHVYEVTTGAKEGSAFALALNLISKGSPGADGLTKWAYRLGDLSKNLGNSVTFGNSTIEGIFTALASDSRFKVVSSPSLRVKGGSSARFSVGSDVPVLGTVQVDKNGNPVQSVEYKPSGVILDIKPRIMDDEIELTINQQLSSFIPTTTGVNNSPTLTKREINTTIGATDGDVIVLGGLDESKSSNDSSGLPYLPRFLRANGQEDNKTELLLVMEVQKI